MVRKIRVLMALLLMPSFSLFAHFDTLYDVNARGYAMGGAVGALYEDVNAISLSPGALPFVKKAAVSVTGSPMYLGMSDGVNILNFVGNVVLPLGFVGTPGMSFNYFSVIIPEVGRLYQTMQYTASYGYALPIPAFDIGIGVSGRVQHWMVPADALGTTDENISKTTGNLNAGIFFRTPYEPVSVAVIAQNLISANNSATAKDLAEGEKPASTNRIPRSVTVAAAFCKGNEVSVDFDAQFVLGSESKVNLALGAEYTFFDMVSIRGGVELRDLGQFNSEGLNASFLDSLRLSFGIGYQVVGLHIDIAYRYTLSVSTFGTIAASVGFAFNSPARVKPPKDWAEKRAEIMARRAEKKREREEEKRRAAEVDRIEETKDLEDKALELEEDAKKLEEEIAEMKQNIAEFEVEVNAIVDEGEKQVKQAQLDNMNAELKEKEDELEILREDIKSIRDQIKQIVDSMGAEGEGDTSGEGETSDQPSNEEMMSNEERPRVEEESEATPARAPGFEPESTDEDFPEEESSEESLPSEDEETEDGESAEATPSEDGEYTPSDEEAMRSEAESFAEDDDEEF